MVGVEPVAIDSTADLGARAIARVRRRLIPFLALLYFVAYLDRVNVGFAALQMNHALGLSPLDFGRGAGIFFLGYFLFEVPSNLALARVGARIWIARIAIVWGLVSMAMVLAAGSSGRRSPGSCCSCAASPGSTAGSGCSSPRVCLR